eukprot:6768701-Karenia_brevis.AAC.1
MNWQQMHREIPHFKLANMYKADKKRVEISCPGLVTQLDTAIDKDMKITPTTMILIVMHQFKKE